MKITKLLIKKLNLIPKVKNICLTILVLFVQHLNAQNKLQIDEFGKEMFKIVQNEDTITLNKYKPTKQNILDFIQTSTMTNDVKKKLLKVVDSGLEEISLEVNPSVIKTNIKGAAEGVVWRETKYQSTFITFQPQPNDEQFRPIEIQINFTYYNIKFKFKTECVILKEKTLIMSKFVWSDN